MYFLECHRLFCLLKLQTHLLYSAMTELVLMKFLLIWFSMLQITYLHGAYDADGGFVSLNEDISLFEQEKSDEHSRTRRLFYLALPPSVYPVVSKMIRKYCMNQSTFLAFHACFELIRFYSFLLILIRDCCLRFDILNMLLFSA